MTPVDRETPRTDANLIYVSGYYYVSPDFARQLERELSAAQRDAERYRWLRGLGPHGDTALVDVLVMDENEDGATDVWYRPTPEELDAAIDAAIKESGNG